MNYTHLGFLHMHDLIKEANRMSGEGWALVSVCPSATGAGYIAVFLRLDSHGLPGVG